MMRAFPLLLVSLTACSEAGKVPVAAEPAPIASSPVVVNAAEPAPAPVSAKADTRAPEAPPRAFGPSADCQIHGRGEWSAHIDAMPGPNGGPRLIVSGTIGTKPAARAELRLDPAVLESNPPQRIVNLVVRLPTEPTIDSLTRREVRGEWPVTPPIGAVHVRCGGRSVASITDIVVAR
jgi:hypothetical protein